MQRTRLLLYFIALIALCSVPSGAFSPTLDCFTSTGSLSIPSVALSGVPFSCTISVTNHACLPYVGNITIEHDGYLLFSGPLADKSLSVSTELKLSQSGTQTLTISSSSSTDVKFAPVTASVFVIPGILSLIPPITTIIVANLAGNPQLALFIGTC